MARPSTRNTSLSMSAGVATARITTQRLTVSTRNCKAFNESPPCASRPPFCGKAQRSVSPATPVLPLAARLQASHRFFQFPLTLCKIYTAGHAMKLKGLPVQAPLVNKLQVVRPHAHLRVAGSASAIVLAVCPRSKCYATHGKPFRGAGRRRARRLSALLLQAPQGCSMRRSCKWQIPVHQYG